MTRRGRHRLGPVTRSEVEALCARLVDMHGDPAALAPCAAETLWSLWQEKEAAAVTGGRRLLRPDEFILVYAMGAACGSLVAVLVGAV